MSDRARSEAADLREGGAWTRRQRLKNDLVYALAIAALAIARRLPRRLVAAIGQLLGAIAWRMLPRERALVRARLAAGLGEPAPEARVRGAFRAIGAALADTLALLDPREPAGRTLALTPEAREVFRAALAEGRGVIFVAAHLGAWERMAALLAEEGFPVATVARESYDPRFTRLYDRLRAPRRVRAIYRGHPGAATAIVRELAAGRAVGFLIDLPSRVPSLPATLFGAATRIPVGPARIALSRRAAVVVGTCAPAHDRRASGGELPSTVVIERLPTADLSPGAGGEQALVARLARALDARIAACPEAWLGLFAPPDRGGREAPHDRETLDPAPRDGAEPTT